MLDDILKDRGFPKELINLSHFFKINISSSFSDDEKRSRFPPLELEWKDKKVFLSISPPTQPNF